MASAETVKVIAEFLNLAAKEIDVVAGRVRFEPAAQATALEILHGLSSATKKTAADLPQTFDALPQADRERMVPALEKSGVIGIMNLLIPLLRMGHVLDPCLLLHEAAKVAYATASILNPSDLAGAIIEGVAAGLDVAAQICAQDASEKADVLLNAMEEAVIRLEQKIDYIMDLPDGAPIPKTPPDVTPVSLTVLNNVLASIQQKIDYIMDLPDGAPIPKTPPDTKPVSLTMLEKMLEVTKKFYKFEGCFTPTFEKDKQLIRMGPLASAPIANPPIPLLVTGFVDLGGMQDNDVVTITTKVLQPPCPGEPPRQNPARYIIWRVRTFTGRQSSGMKHFQDFADLLEVPGDGVELLIAQSASSHNFDRASLLTIPYQFLIESTVAPQFSVS